MQAPHRPVPHPYLVPVRLRPSRITHSSGVEGGASVDAAFPFTVKFVAIASSLSPCGAKAVAGRYEKGWRSPGACRFDVRLWTGVRGSIYNAADGRHFPNRLKARI